MKYFILGSIQHTTTNSDPHAKSVRLSVGWILYLFGLTLLFADFFLLRSEIGGTVGKALNYGLRVFIGASVLLLVLLEILKPRRRKLINVLLGGFLLVCVSAFIRWTVDGEAPITTILGNPSFSIFVWTFVLLVDLTSRHHLQPNLLHHLGNWSPALTIMAGWLFFFASDLLNIKLYYPALFILVCIQLSTQTFASSRRLLEYILALIGAFALFLATDYRSYALAIIAASLFRVLRLGKSNRAFLISLIILTLPIAYIAILNVYGGFEFYIGEKNALVDTRSFLIVELFEDMSLLDIAIGKGLDGTYFSPYFYGLIGEAQNNADFYQRSGLEMGVLNILLKLGLFGLIPFLLIYLVSLLVTPKRIPTVEIKNLRVVSLTFFFLFTIEAPQAINSFYFLWFYVIGMCLSGITSKSLHFTQLKN